MARSLRPYEAFRITTRNLEVLRVADVTSGMRRVTLGGEQLAAHTADNGFGVEAFRSEGFDDEFKVLLKHPDVDEVVVPKQADGVLDWSEDPEHRLMRTYTVRRWDPVAGELDVDFVQHGVGPATSWARRVQPGERVQIAGPKSSAQHPVGADWVLVAGDETALPAIGRWLEEWPTGARGQVFIEVAEADHHQELHVPEGVELTWLTRDGAEPGTTTLLFDAITSTDWWDGTCFAWVAGEATTLTPIRRWLRREKELTKEQCEITGYWRRQEVVVSEADAEVPDLAATGDDAETLHELSELLPGVALRIAAGLDFGEVFDGESRSVQEVATATGADPEGVRRLMRYLAALDVYEHDGLDRYRPTAMGRLLEQEQVADALDLRRYHAQEELGTAIALPAAVMTGRGDYQRWYGSSFPERLQAEPKLLASQVEEGESLAGYLSGMLVNDPVFAGISTLLVNGRGAATIGEAFVKAGETRSAVVLATPAEIEAIQAMGIAHPALSYQPGTLLNRPEQPADAVLLSHQFQSLPDADAQHVLRTSAEAVGPDGVVLVFVKVLNPDRAHDHDYEHDLIGFTLYGGGEREHAEYSALFDRSGLTLARQATLGWGITLYELRPQGN
ncbi:SIP domain-containing protein [Dermacoccaceae bacterium W4C1]